MKILKLTESKHVKERYYIELEGGEIIKVDLNLIARYSLFSGRELTEQELESLRDDSRRAMAKAKALKIMGSRNMSRKEITDRLLRKGESSDVADSTAQWLEDVGAVNDSEYAAMIVRHYSKMGYGAGRVKNELYKRGIPRELWQEALEELPDMQESAYEVLLRRLGGSADRTKLKKASDALVRRGFSWEEVRSAVTRYRDEHELETEEYD
ncbi:MAG: regulatory protein RecX [Oscillospiraceae bacterium]|nr:regulatory protein RecX [Oscillospiraceae bacterium]